MTDVQEVKPLLKPFVIGLDLGGTNSVFGVVDQRGQVLATTSIKTQSYKTVEDFVDASIEVLKPIIAKVGIVKSKNRRNSGTAKLVDATSSAAAIYSIRAVLARRSSTTPNIGPTKNTKYTPKNVATSTVIVDTVS